MYLMSPFLSAPCHEGRLGAPRGRAEPGWVFVPGAPLCGLCPDRRFEACGEEIKLPPVSRPALGVASFSPFWLADGGKPTGAPRRRHRAPAHLLAGRAGGCGPAPHQLRPVLFPGMAADRVVRDGGG